MAGPAAEFGARTRPAGSGGGSRFFKSLEGCLCWPLACVCWVVAAVVVGGGHIQLRRVDPLAAAPTFGRRQQRIHQRLERAICSHTPD